MTRASTKIAHCSCGKRLRTKEEQSFDMCKDCLNQTGVTTKESKIPVPQGSSICPGDCNTEGFDRMLYLIHWWTISVQQCSPEEVEYVARRLEEQADNLRSKV